MKIFLMAFPSFLSVACSSADPVAALEDSNKSVRERYSDVIFLTTTELANKLEQAVPLLLIDVRAPKEFRVSHLPGAHNAPKPSKHFADTPRDTLIVVYCSIGVRSARAAQQLQALGFSNVYNLEGSIFQWANEDRPVVGSEGPASGVHPFNRYWGRFLKPEHWQWKP
ncbi:MAG: rhodanese-like domain-containing protein [Verrucomicrobiales bacterium]